jgi:Peptidase family U32
VTDGTKGHLPATGNGEVGPGTALAGSGLLPVSGAAALAQAGLVAESTAPASQARFPDGAHFRIEIPSVEGPAVLRAVIAEAKKHGITVNRVSQGSGAMLLSSAELTEMANIAADSGLEVSLFVGPREEWDIGRAANADDGQVFAGRLRGTRQLRYAVDDIVRASEHGIRGFLIADPGLLQLVNDLQAAGQLPTSIVWKVSAVLAPSNPLSFRLLEQLGATTINVPSDLTLGQIAEMRAVSGLPIDLYVETPDAMGGVVRGHEAAELISTAAPMYTKFGLRNSRPLYPSGAHLVDEASAIAREKVHRAAVALEWIARSGLELVQSQPGAKGLGVPEPQR